MKPQITQIQSKDSWQICEICGYLLSFFFAFDFFGRLARRATSIAFPSHSSSFSVGCYCEVEARCHRSVLREVLKARGAEIV